MLTEAGARWAIEHCDLGLMETVALDPAGWPPGFVRLAVSVANGAGLEEEAWRIARRAVDRDPARVLDLLAPEFGG